MNRIFLDMNYTRKIEDGSCVVQCFELLFKFFGYEINSYTMLGMSECFDVRYRSIDYKQKIPSLISINRSWHLEHFLNQKTKFTIRRSAFDDIETGFAYLFGSLDNGIPVCVGLNPYYVTYSEDYYVNYGGLFKNYHMVLVNGYDKEKKVFNIVDPSLDVADGIISFSDLTNGWNEPIGMRDNYVPYTYYKFYPENGYKYDSSMYSCMIEEVFNNFRSYNDSSIVEYIDGKYVQGKFAVESMIKDLKGLDFNKENMETSISSLRNIYDGIFNGIRWMRKSFFLFLENNVKYNSDNYSELKKRFGGLFEAWSTIGMKLSLIIQLKKYNNLELVINEMDNIFNLEQFLVSEMIKELNNAKTSLR